MGNYGLLGGKLGHSLSPKIHSLFFKYSGISAEYSLFEAETDELQSKIAYFRENLAGVNVTIPHKLNVIPLIDSVSEEAKAIGAVNTVKFENGRADGYNTDYFGFRRMLEFNGIEIVGKNITLLGSGGAARAVMKCLSDMNAGKIQIYSISDIPEDFLGIAKASEIINYNTLLSSCGEVIINCTPVGMYPNTEASPVPAEVSKKFETSVDVIYNPVETVFLKQAKSFGKLAVNGLFMLVAQAVASEEIWQNKKYDSELILKIMDDLVKEI